VHDLLNPTHLIETFSYIGVFSIVLLESGFIFGFFLPGDSLLFTAGLLAAEHHINIVGLIIVSIIGAILGNNLGYFTGNRLGGALFTKEKSVLFSPKRVAEAHDYFIKQGAQSLILARFIPAVRTFVPIVAGVAKMKYRQFAIFNAVGAILWGFLIPILGYTLGRTVPSIDKYLLPIIFVIIVISLIPVVVQYRKARNSGDNNHA
jgi:membrane-associated protein